jgi:outer membrane protein assembly factor BamB
VYALDARSGSKLWSFPSYYAIQSAPAVVNGVVYIGSLDHDVYALDAHTGAELWNFGTGAYVGSSPTIANGILYITSWDGNIYALNASTGAKLWSVQTNHCCMDSSAAASDGVVYVGSNAGYIG